MSSAYVSLWEFEVRLNECVSILLSNSSLLNLVCSAFANYQQQAVAEIITSYWNKDCAKFVVIVKSEEAEKNLLKNFALNKIQEALNESIYSISSEIFVVSIDISQAAYVSDISDEEFDIILSDARIFLQNMKDREKHFEICFTNSSSLSDSSKIFSAPVSLSCSGKLVDGILNRPYTTQTTAPSASSDSDSTFESLKNFVSYYHNLHGRPTWALGITRRSNWNSQRPARDVFSSSRSVDWNDDDIYDMQDFGGCKTVKTSEFSSTQLSLGTKSNTSFDVDPDSDENEQNDAVFKLFNEELAQCLQDVLATAQPHEASETETAQNTVENVAEASNDGDIDAIAQNPVCSKVAAASLADNAVEAKAVDSDLGENYETASDRSCDGSNAGAVGEAPTPKQ